VTTLPGPLLRNGQGCLGMKVFPERAGIMCPRYLPAQASSALTLPLGRVRIRHFGSTT